MAIALRVLYTACMKQRHPTPPQMDNHETARDRSGLVVLQYVGGHVLVFGGAALFVLGLTVATGPQAIVIVVLGVTLTFAGAVVAILAFAQGIIGAILSAFEDVVARTQDTPPTPPSSSTL